MNLYVFNAALLIAWALLTAGGFLISPAVGCLLGGGSLLVLTLLVVRIAGGVLVEPTAPGA